MSKEKQFDQILLRLDQQDDMLGQIFHRFDQMFERLEHSDIRIMRLEQKVERMDQRLTGRIDHLEASIDSMNAKMDGRITNLEPGELPTHPKPKKGRTNPRLFLYPFQSPSTPSSQTPALHKQTPYRSAPDPLLPSTSQQHLPRS